MVSVGEILKRDAVGDTMDAAYKRVDIFDVINKNMEIEKIDVGSDKYGEYAIVYFTTKEAIKSWSRVLVKQAKVLKEWLDEHDGETVKARIVKPKGKAYYTFEDWK